MIKGLVQRVAHDFFIPLYKTFSQTVPEVCVVYAVCDVCRVVLCSGVVC